MRLVCLLVPKQKFYVLSFFTFVTFAVLPLIEKQASKCRNNRRTAKGTVQNKLL